MKSILLTITCLLGFGAMAQVTTGDIIGTFYEADSSDVIVQAQVFTKRGDAVYRAVTDIDGRFRLTALPPGQYEVKFIYNADTTSAPFPVEVLPEGIASVGDVYNGGKELPELEVKAKIWSLDKGVESSTKLTAKDIKHLPTKFSAVDMVASMTTDVQKTNSGELVFRGARAGDFITYLDGVKMTELQNVPSASLGYVMVFSGAIPAKYGDTTGGIVVMETLSYFDLLREWENRK